MSVALQVDNISVSYGDAAPVLRGVSLELNDKELVAVLGTNGAGKSTLLRAISGLLPLRGGRVVLNGEDISAMPPHRRVACGLVHVPEGRQMLAGLSVRENLVLGGYVRRHTPASARDAAEQEIYQLFPILAERRHQLAGSLSGGEQQMLALGRALMAAPKVLLCDEPSLGIAPRVVSEIFGAIARMRDRGIPILLIEQNAKKALAVADRAILIQRGEVKLSASAGDLQKDGALSPAYLGG
jgi:branched-chain amino acid transport system ATP-binding protein